MIYLALRVVTPATILSALGLGIILGIAFLPAFEKAIGASDTRRTWGTFVGIETIGVAFFLAAAVGRYLDGSDVWLSWLGTILLWTLMAGAATATRRLASDR